MAAINSANHGTIQDVLDAAFQEEIADRSEEIYKVVAGTSFGLSTAALITVILVGFQKVTAEYGRGRVPLQTAVLLEMLQTEILHIGTAWSDTLFTTDDQPTLNNPIAVIGKAKMEDHP